MAAEFSSTPDRFDRASDWCNPILVKEVRQALKSRAFVATFLLLLLGSWLISAFGLLAAGASVEYGSVGQAFFIFYFGVLCVALGVVIPFGAFRSLLNERDDNTYELLSITTLSPGQIVRGKWACAVVQALLFYSAIAPFIAFTALLQGFDFGQAAVLLVAAFYGSTALSITTLMLSTTVRQRVWQGFLSMTLVAALCVFVTMILSGLSSLMMFPLPLDEPDFWWFVAALFVMSASYQWLFYQIAAARLTFESENRSTGIRLTVSGQFWLMWAMAGIFHWYRGTVPDDELVWFLTGASGVHLALLGLSFSAEPNGLSRRVRRSLPQRTWLRVPLAPLLPGGARGYLFVLLHLAALLPLVAVATAWSKHRGIGPSTRYLGELVSLKAAAWDESRLLFAVAVVSYIAFYSGLAACFLRWGRSITPAFNGAHARTMIVILIASGFMVPMGMRIGRFVPYNDASLSDVFFPFWLLIDVVAGIAEPLHLWVVAGAAFAAIGLNVPTLVHSVREILNGPHRSSSRPHVSPGVVAEESRESRVESRESRVES
ncbi:MAG: hypothetical protein WBC44_17490 [Planctomycetaceae bacterium]